MEYTRLGQTDLRVSRIAFGTWAFGGEWGRPFVVSAAAFCTSSIKGRGWIDFGRSISSPLLQTTLQDAG